MMSLRRTTLNHITYGNWIRRHHGQNFHLVLMGICQLSKVDRNLQACVMSAAMEICLSRWAKLSEVPDS